MGVAVMVTVVVVFLLGRLVHHRGLGGVGMQPCVLGRFPLPRITAAVHDLDR
jgi:hypothetical protein